MKDKYLDKIMLVLFGLLTFTVNAKEPNAVRSEMGLDSAGGLSIAKVQFSKPLTLEDTVSQFFGTNIDIAIIESQYKIGHKSLNEFYALPSHTSAYDIDVHSYKEEYKRHRRFMINAVLESSKELDQSLKQDDDMLNSMKAKLADNDGAGILVKGVVLVGDEIDLSMMMQKRNIQSIEIAKVDTIREKTRAKTPVQKQRISLAQANGPWEPDQGYSFVNANSGYRFSLQYMGWYTNNFGSNATYEHDFFLNNYNNNLGTYLDSNSTSYPGCFPVATYAATTWPSGSYPYLDTRLAENLVQCENQEIPYTIGAAKADAIPAGIWQYTYIETASGSVNSDKFKLQGQKGYRSPSWCYTTWCSFSDAIVNLVPAWNPSVPGSVAW